MTTVVAFADDVTLTPESPDNLQRHPDIFARWAWFSRMTWSVKKCSIVAPPMHQVQVRLCGEEFTGTGRMETTRLFNCLLV
jgi:hypothetical protein